MRRGQWKPFVDAEPVRQHVLMLKREFQLGDRTIARLAGLDRKRIQILMHGRSERGTPPPSKLRAATAAAILSVEPTLDDLPARFLLDATGSHRRIQALVAGGWPLEQLGQRLGVVYGASSISDRLQRQQITAGMVRAIRVLYDELWQLDPREHGVTAQGYSRARNYARREGWAPVGAWDDDTIDDPAAEPDWTGRCGTRGGYSDHRAQGSPTCARCRKAQAEYERERRGRERETAPPTRGGAVCEQASNSGQS